MFEIKPDLNKSNILSQVSELDIFRYYCGNFHKPGEMFRSELRKDDQPSCKIDNYRGNIKYKDFSEKGTLSCFDYVMAKYHVDYHTALSIINQDFNLGLESKEINIKKSEKIPVINNEQYNKISTGESTINVHYKHWDSVSIDYISSYKLDYNRISSKFKCNPIDYFWINNNQFKAANLSFASYFGVNKERYIYKIYQPLEKKYKWFHNLNPAMIQGWYQLPESGEGIMITKGYKDVWCYDRFNIPAIAPGAEGWDIPEKVMDNLFERFYTIVCQYDWDRAGIKGMNKLRKRYGIRAIPILQGKYSKLVKSDKYWVDKDFSDFCRNNSLQTIQEEITRVKYYLNL